MGYRGNLDSAALHPDYKRQLPGILAQSLRLRIPSLGASASRGTPPTGQPSGKPPDSASAPDATEAPAQQVPRGGASTTGFMRRRFVSSDTGNTGKRETEGRSVNRGLSLITRMERSGIRGQPLRLTTNQLVTAETWIPLRSIQTTRGSSLEYLPSLSAFASLVLEPLLPEARRRPVNPAENHLTRPPPRTRPRLLPSRFREAELRPQGI